MQSEHANRVLGNYELLEKLGAGGMGEVYRAVHTRMERVVAVKVLPERLVRDEAAVLRFQQEVKAAARLSHPNVVTAYDADEADGVHFLVMEYVQGIDLQELVQKFGSLTAAEAVDCVVQAARGLEYAHGQGVLHRDIKPANLLFDAGGTVRLLDLGLARFDSDASGEPDAAPLTQTGVIMGTVDYMSPEQADDSHTADARSDIYSLGCTLYYLLVGRPPYSGETMLQRILAHRNQPQPDLPAEIPAAVNTVFRRMIARHPDDRFQSMSEVIAALEECRASEESLHDTDPLSRLTGITPAGSPAASAPSESHSRDTLNNTSHLQETVVPQPATSPPPDRRHRSWLIALLLLATTVPAMVFLRPHAPMGTLLLQVDDPSAIGAIATLDEEQQRPLSNEGEYSIEVPADGKPHTLQVARAGFLPLREEITIDAGQTRSIPVRLERRTSPTVAASTRPDVPPRPDFALAFDGRDDEVVIENWPEFDPSRPLTIEAVATPASLTDGTVVSGTAGASLLLRPPPHYRRESGEYTAPPWAPDWVWVADYRAEEYDGHLWLTKSHVGQRSCIPITGQRSHIAVSWDPSQKQLRMFLNGIRVCSTMQYLVPWPGAVRQLHLGRGGSGTFHGTIDSVRISSIVRYVEDFTPQERFEPDEYTLGLYHFDEGRGEVLHDFSGNGRDGKIAGATWVMADGSPIPGDLAIPPEQVRPQPQPTRHETGIADANLGPTDLLLSRDYVWTEPVDLGPHVNGSRYDCYPTLTADGLTMFYMADRWKGDKHDLDIQMVQRTSAHAPFGRPVPLGDRVNTELNEASPCISSDGLELFFARKRSSKNEGYELRVCRRRSRSENFGPPSSLGPEFDRNASGANPALSPDHLSLVFVVGHSSDTTGSELCIATRPDRDTPFGPPVLLTELNTSADERYPRFAPDGHSLLFSSSRGPTLGQEDIWIARRRADGSFDAPVHAGRGLNSAGRDGSVALSSDGRTAIFHRGHDGWFDLWMTRRVPQGEAADAPPEELPASPPEYAAFATGRWTPLLRRREDLTDYTLIRGDSRVAIDDPTTVEGADIADGVLQLERGTILLDKVRAENMIVRARVSTVSGEPANMGIYWPGRRVVQFVLKPGRESGSGIGFSAAQSLKWDATTGWFDRFESVEQREGRGKASELEIALARVGGYVQAYVDGRLIVEIPVPADLGPCSPKFEAYRGTARFRNIEVQFLDDDTSGKVHER